MAPTRGSRDFKNGVPSNEEILDLLDEWGLPEGIKEHSFVVRDIALQIVKKIKENNKDIEIDKKIVEAGALLHDIGRVVSHGLEHGFRGWLLLKGARVDNRVARCALVHVLGGFTLSDVKKEFPVAVRDEINEPLIPESIEEKIVCLADKHAVGTVKVSMNKRFARWFKKHGKTPFLLKSRYRVLQIEKDIKALLQNPVENE